MLGLVFKEVRSRPSYREDFLCWTPISTLITWPEKLCPSVTD